MKAALFALFALSASASAQVTIHEVRIAEPGPDLNEYIELRVTPGTTLSNLSYLVIGYDAVGQSGVVLMDIPIPNVTPSDPYFVIGPNTLTLATPEHVHPLGFPDTDNTTHLLVENFSGAVGDDLDTNDDGTLDATPWTARLSDVSFYASNADFTHQIYGEIVGGDAIPLDIPEQAGRCYYWWLDGFGDTPGAANDCVSLRAFCSPGQLNSAGLNAFLHADASSTATSGVHIEVYGGPPNQFGYLLVGTGFETANPILFGDGTLCLSPFNGNLIGRYNQPGDRNSIGQFDAFHRFQNLVGTSSQGSGFDIPATLPFTTLPTIQSGQDYHFQLWYRDLASPGGSNLSNGMTVLF